MYKQGLSIDLNQDMLKLPGQQAGPNRFRVSEVKSKAFYKLLQKREKSDFAYAFPYPAQGLRLNIQIRSDQVLGHPLQQVRSFSQ